MPELKHEPGGPTSAKRVCDGRADKAPLAPVISVKSRLPIFNIHAQEGFVRVGGGLAVTDL